MVRDFLDAVGRIVGHDDAGRGGGIEIDGVNADAVTRDDLALGHFRHDVGGNRAGVGVQQGIAIGGFGDEFLGLLGLQRHQIRQTGQRFLFHIQ
mgnify:CR=1 FL=1